MANNNTKKRQKSIQSRANADGLISVNVKRNMAMRVYRNKDESGKGQSITVHEPLNKGNFITYKNHSYVEYRQPAV